ncbi:MAG: hypothetical protein SOR40_05240 [Rothia sp. (in: high G+C Gram-positive bacteria)]|nr:hypothetical protein [Rothia sp. (in: high G+C Gram-positive bacteria)]
MKNYLVSTTQKTPSITSISNAHITIDWKREEFVENSTTSLDGGVSFSSALSFQNQALRLDGDPISSNAEFWLNQSSHLMGLSALAHYQTKTAPYTPECNYSGSVQQLNRICENQLNISELGQDSTYTLKISLDAEGAKKVSLTITNSRSDIIFEQITTLQEDSTVSS